MDKIYADADDKYVIATILYGKASDKYLYKDAAHTIKLTKEELFEICSKRALVNYDGAYYVPLTFAYDDDQPCTTVTIVTVADSSPTYLVLNSEEFSE